MLMLISVIGKPCLPKTSMLVGAFVPQCNDDGTWKHTQCHGSTGYCMCVDDEGNQVGDMFQPWIENKVCE